MRWWWLAAIVLISTPVAADEPSGYRCTPGKVNKGVGCTCPPTHVATRDAEKVAVCAAKPPPAVTYEFLVEKGNKLAETNCAKATELWGKALELKPNGIEALTGIGYCAIDEKNFATAHRRFQTALSISPRYEPALAGDAETYQREGRRDDAIAAWRRYLEVFPGARKATVALERLGASTNTNPQPNPTEPKRSADELWKAGSRHFEAAAWDDAIAVFRELHTRFPDHERANHSVYFVGLALYNQSKWRPAIVEWQLLAQKYPASPLADDGYYFAALAAQRLKACGEALRYLSDLLAKFPNSNVRNQATDLRKSIQADTGDRSKCNQ